MCRLCHRYMGLLGRALGVGRIVSRWGTGVLIINWEGVGAVHLVEVFHLSIEWKCRTAVPSLEPLCDDTVRQSMRLRTTLVEPRGAKDSIKTTFLTNQRILVYAAI